MLTQEELKGILEYNPDNGVFTWKVAQKYGKRKVGDIAGHLNADRYWHIIYKKKVYKAHRLAWLYTYGEFPEDMLDHIDGDKSNNRLINLRGCSRSENQKNQKLAKNNTSGFKGVYQDKKSGKWRAVAMLNGKNKHLGVFLTPEEAYSTYNAFAKVNHGEFYRDTKEQVDNALDMAAEGIS